MVSSLGASGPYTQSTQYLKVTGSFTLGVITPSTQQLSLQGNKHLFLSQIIHLAFIIAQQK
jgi:hypothetical protein